MAKNSGAFVLTPTGGKEGRYNVARMSKQSFGSCDFAPTGVKIVEGATPRSKDTIRSIVSEYAVGLKRLADR